MGWDGWDGAGGGQMVVLEQECVETEVLCFYLRDCNVNHTSVTGLVAPENSVL